MDEIEEEAKAAAEKMVMNMMQRPGQLEKVSKLGKKLLTLSIFIDIAPAIYF